MSGEEREWLVLRTDDAGNTFLVRAGLDEADAQSLVTDLTARGHKQTYSAIPYDGVAAKAELLVRLKVRF
jgi:hypothetical protein